MNKTKRGACSDRRQWWGIGIAALMCGVAAAATPDLNGIWEPVNPPTALRTAQGSAPPLHPAQKELYERRLAARAHGDVSFDATERCLPAGVPRILFTGPFEIVQQPAQVTLLYQWNRQVRYVWMGISQPPVPGPMFQGQSVGRWVNGTLVIDTVGFGDTDTLLDTAGLPHSDALHVTEVYVPSADGKRLTVRITIDDSKAYSRRWTTELDLRRSAASELVEDYCLERKGVSWGQLRQTGVERRAEQTHE